MSEDLSETWHELQRRFAARESSDVTRTRTVAELLGAEGCLVRGLLRYFGEELGRDCGHCGRSEGDVPVKLVREAAEVALPTKELAALRKSHPRALANPRQVARFLCGISSPALSAAKLTRHPRFGYAASVPFAQVMTSVAAI